MPETTTAVDLKATILAVLDENRVMTVATLREDGWPQATMVGFVHDDLTLYFAVSRDSQKLANVTRDPRVSIAIGQDGGSHIRGLSMAARALEVSDTEEVLRLNALIVRRYPGQVVFAPRTISSAVLRATPTLISLIDHSKGPGQPVLLEITRESSVHQISA